MKRVAVFISGRGSNLKSLIEAQAKGAPYEIVAVLSNRPEAPGLAYAVEADVEAIAIDHRPFGKDRAAWEAAATQALTGLDVDFIALAGFMRVLTPGFVSDWGGRMVNIHPSLLPAFPGLDTHARALAAGVKLHGCTVHWVTPGVDEGPIIGQAAVPVRPSDDAQSLAARVLEAEHGLYPICLSLATAGQSARIRGFGPPADRAILLNGFLTEADGAGEG